MKFALHLSKVFGNIFLEFNTVSSKETSEEVDFFYLFQIEAVVHKYFL